MPRTLQERSMVVELAGERLATSLGRPAKPADIAPDVGLEEEEVITIRALPEREREVLGLRFFEDLTQTEIADRLGVSQMQISRLLQRSLRRLRTVAESADGG